MGLTGVFGFNSLLYTSLKSTTAANAALINGTGPLIFSLMAALTLRERLTARNLAGALVSLAGVVIIISGGSLDALLGLRFNLGDLLVLAAVVVWGVYSMLGRLVTRTRSAFAATALSNWIGLAMLYPAAIVEQARQPAAPGWLVILAAVYIGVGPSFVSFLAWNEGVRRVGATRATVFYNMLPFYGTLLGVLILHEPLGWAQVIGGALILAGSLISVWPDLWSSH
jgi:drug/metabolite transporter (DMT)-like permease